MNTSVICFGEVLWDVLPTGKQPGGAPFNVAVHLHQLGMPVQLISCVGDDAPGRELPAFTEHKFLKTRYLQHSAAHLTGMMKANVDDAHEVLYKIVQPVAWDYIQAGPALDELVRQADVLVFGSLAARQADTHTTLYHLLQRARLKVFDVHMRVPHYTLEVVEHLLGHADLVKLNHHELQQVPAWFGTRHEQELDRPAAMRWLAGRYRLQAVCVTCGGRGRDTIGSAAARLATPAGAGRSPALCLHRRGAGSYRARRHARHFGGRCRGAAGWRAHRGLN